MMGPDEEPETMSDEVREQRLLAREQSELEDALQFAWRAHSGQRDKAGQPYILHPLRMMGRAERHEVRILCLLHDIQEDAPDLLPEVLARYAEHWPYLGELLDDLTRRNGESYTDYIQRAGRTSLTRRVKILDLQDNLALKRITALLTPGANEPSFARLKRYLMALVDLQQKEEK